MNPSNGHEVQIQPSYQVHFAKHQMQTPLKSKEIWHRRQ